MSIPLQLTVPWSKDLEDLTFPDTGASISYKRSLYPDDPAFSTFLSSLVHPGPENPPSLWITARLWDPNHSPPIATIEDQSGFLLMPVRKSSSSTSSNPKKPRKTAPTPPGQSKTSTASAIVSPPPSKSKVEMSAATLELLSSAPTTTPLTGGPPSPSRSESHSSEGSASPMSLPETQLLMKSSSQKSPLKRTDTQSRIFVNTVDKTHLDVISTLEDSSQ